MTARTSGTSTITSLKISVRCQSEASLEVDEQAPEPEHRRAIGVGNGQVADFGLQLERVDPHLADAQLAAVVLARRT